MPVKDIDCESLVIGTLLNNSKAIESVRSILDDDCFTDDTSTEVYQAVKSVDSSGDDVNLITVNAQLRKTNSGITIPELVAAQQLSTVGDLTNYALRLKELSIRRRMWLLGQNLISAGTTESDDLDEVRQKAHESITQLFGCAQSSMITLADAYAQLHQQMLDNRRRGGGAHGTPTGFPELDRRGGLTPSDLIIIAGESSHGKTSLATAFMMNAMKAGAEVAMYSMEMTATQMAGRIAAMRSGVSALSISQSMLPEDKIMSIGRSMSTFDMTKLHFDDRATSSIDNILSSIRTMKIKYDIKGAVIDYLQILNVNRGRDFNKEQAMGDAARRLKNLAKDLNIWIIALSQLSRDKDRPEPDMNRLRDSGQIAEAADVVMLVWRPELKGNTSYPGEYSSVSTAGTAMVNVAKGRNIGTFRFICGFDAKCTMFYPLSDLPHKGEITQAPSFKDDGGELPF